jgi:hypothetical protein
MDKKIFFATGDLGVKRPNEESIFDKVRDILKQGDLIFGQLEPCISDVGTPSQQARLPMRCKPEGAKAIANAGFNVISFATNHCMDWGRDAFFRTIELIKQNGMLPVGVGENIEEARKPVIVDLDGTRIGFLAYCSVNPQDYWALKDRPGCNPMRPLYAGVLREHDQPGTPLVQYTWPHPEDLQNMIDDITALRPQVDILMVSQHWGIHFTPRVLAEYQRYVAHFAIDAGADIILGHHTHILKPIEVYKNKAIIYSMANFAIEGPDKFFEGKQGLINDSRHDAIRALNTDFKNDSGRVMPVDSYKSILLKCVIDDRKIKSVSFLPLQLDQITNDPEILKANDPRFGEIVEYMEEITIDQKIEPHFTIEGEEVRII